MKAHPAPSTHHTKPISSFLRQRATGLDVFRLSDEEIADLLIAPPTERCPQGSRVGDPIWHFKPEHYPNMPPKSVCVSYIGQRGLMAPASLRSAIQRFNLSVMIAPLGVQPDLSSLKQKAATLNRVADWLSGQGLGKFQQLEKDRLPDLWEHLGANWRKPSNWDILRKILWEMERQQRRGLLLDWLPWADPLDPASLLGEMRSFHQNPSPVYDAPERPVHDQSEEDGAWLPLCDEWLQAAGFRWIFLLKHILPNLLRIAQDWERINKPSFPRRKAHGGFRREPLSDPTAKDKLNASRRRFLAGFEWRDADGEPLERLPFELLGSDRLPVLWTDLQRLISCVQKSLYSLLLLLTAGRRSEISTLKRSGGLIELVDENIGLSNLLGRTYKLSGFSVGEETGWPIPSTVAQYLRNWLTFTDVTHPASTSVWVSWSSTPYATPAYGVWPDSLSKLFGLDSLTGGIPAHSHRFRKTMARLAVLCLVGAPMILMQMLGHDTLVTTLKYIFSDPYIRDELALVLQELRLEIAVLVAEGLDESGGKGAKTLQQARDDFIASLKVSSNERAQRYRARDFAAAQLADGGVDLKVIFAGIICIKPGDTPGRCSRHTIDADISRCETECPFFLALPTAKVWTRATLEWLIAELQDKDVQSNPLLETFYRAQFVDQARIFEDLRLEYAGHSRAKKLLPAPLQRQLETSL